MRNPHNLVECLREVRGLISCGWTQGVFARDAEGVWCRPGSDKVCCVCLHGAILLVVKPGNNLVDACIRALGFREFEELQKWNDAEGRTVQEVIARVDAALRLYAEKKKDDA